MASISAMSTSVLLSTRPSVARPGVQRPAPRRLAPLRANPFIGEVNDPEKTKKNKEKKDHDSVWAEPKNNNPLEKTTLSREGFGKQSKQMKDEQEVNKFTEGVKDAADNVKEGVKDAADKVADAAKKATGQK
ncbi:hypothetical protein COCSUDRAFT_66322 [Coccomyxa subellipsoidea C-169]|uniref:Uncharacterized protein n=1 Tax=Coccomyxa subellipsoidea (strain C-169) TaxID=574566 RepID=I0YW67_COCSC|nr:hypothetical protein COCSUDRAFT_66322 [Coccomyxa subellipsoidea C-169]EIE22636.1 hypothetical protein COCSUDRAFT_66322 [Coccomyxa subellipsoidea C-169]|eukprot:XP_005647180.1 hypothetical protein COCSUDRAFT_66322 [Coccomyxa subellipsoidea C-169]